MHDIEERALAMRCLELAVRPEYQYGSYDAIEYASQMLKFVLTGEHPRNRRTDQANLIDPFTSEYGSTTGAGAPA